MKMRLKTKGKIKKRERYDESKLKDEKYVCKRKRARRFLSGLNADERLDLNSMLGVPLPLLKHALIWARGREGVGEGGGGKG